MAYERNLKVIFSRKPRVLSATCISLNWLSNSSGIKNSVDALEGEYDGHRKWSFFDLKFCGNAHQPCRKGFYVKEKVDGKLSYL